MQHLLMQWALRFLAASFIASVVTLALGPLLPPRPAALQAALFFFVAAASNAALSWRAGDDARGFAIVTGISLVVMMAGLTLFLPGAWSPWLPAR